MQDMVDRSLHTVLKLKKTPVTGLHCLGLDEDVWIAPQYVGQIISWNTLSELIPLLMDGQ